MSFGFARPLQHSLLKPTTYFYLRSVNRNLPNFSSFSIASSNLYFESKSPSHLKRSFSSASPEEKLAPGPLTKEPIPIKNNHLDSRPIKPTEEFLQEQEQRNEQKRENFLIRESEQYDLIVLGSGPAGQRAAICAAKLGKRVVLVDEKDLLGGVCLNTGTIPSKTLREAILYLSGFQQRGFYGKGYVLKEHLTFSDLTQRVKFVIQQNKEVINSQLKRNKVQFVQGWGSFVDPHTIKVEGPDSTTMLQGAHIFLATGTKPARAPNLPFDGKLLVDSDQFLNLEDIPRQLIVVGAGVIGIEYASMMSCLRHVNVTVIDQRPSMLDFVDTEIIDNLSFHMREQGAKFRLGEKVDSVYTDQERGIVVASLASGKKVVGDCLLYCVGRQCNTDRLNLQLVGLQTDSRGKLLVNEFFQTQVPHVYAAGDIIGFPALASASYLQGRFCVEHMFNPNVNPLKAELIPYGIYSIPEISMVGKNEQQLTQEKVPYEYGVAKFSEVSRGLLQGDEMGGLLKLLFHRETRRLLGVHAIGQSATETIHIGQACLTLGLTLDHLISTVYNFNTFSEAYHQAALDGLMKLDV